MKYSLFFIDYKAR